MDRLPTSEELRLCWQMAQAEAFPFALRVQLLMLTIVDTFSRFSSALEPRFTFRGVDVVEVLERVGRQVRLPATIRVDQGTEFVSRDLDLWAYQRGVTLDFSRPGKPTDNAFIESFNGRFRAECLNAHWFLSFADAEKMEAWRKDHNEVRPHGAIIASLIETCKLGGIDPQTYIADVITRIVNGHPNSRIDEFLPWAYAPSADLKAVA